jgi:hypothetical protein
MGRRLAAPARTRGRVRAISCQLRGQAAAVKDPALPVRPCLFQRNRLAADVTDESSRHITWKIVGHWYSVNPTNVWLAPHSYRPYGTGYRRLVFPALMCRALLFRRVAASTVRYRRDSSLMPHTAGNRGAIFLCRCRRHYRFFAQVDDGFLYLYKGKGRSAQQSKGA